MSVKSSRSYRGMSMEKRRAQRRTQLIAAAKQAFGEYGYQATTVKQICREAELTERYFYESFENLNALFGVTYDQELDRLRETLTLAIASSTTDVEAMARSGMQAYYGFLKQDPHAARILLIEIYGTTHDMIRLYRRGVQDFAGLIRGIIELQYPQAQPLVLDPGLLATALVGAAIQLAMRWYLGGYEESEESMVDNTVAIITALSDKLTQTPA